MPAVHQFVPAFEPGAVGQHTIEVQRALRDAGFECEVFAHIFHPEMAGKGHPFEDYGTGYPARPGDWLMYQFAIGSPVAGFVRSRPEPKILYHHNLTPPEMLAAWEPAIVPGLLWGQRQLLELAGSVEFALADSSFNRDDLRRAGYRDVDVVPILLDLDAFDCTPDPATLRRIAADRATGGCDWLFVGRVVPNKCQHDLVKALAAYRAAYDSNARLRIVGGASSSAYADALRAFAETLGVAHAVDVAGSVTHAELSAYYRSADVFVSMSEHEGFGVPLLEAMHHEVPIVAFAAAAVPETMAGAGLLVDDKRPASVAAAVHRVLVDDGLRSTFVAAGARRLGDFDLARTRARLLSVLEARGVGATR